MNNITIVGNLTSDSNNWPPEISRVTSNLVTTSLITTEPTTAVHVSPHSAQAAQLYDQASLLASWDGPGEYHEGHASTKSYHDNDRNHEFQPTVSPDRQHVRDVGGQQLPASGPACAYGVGVGREPRVTITTSTSAVVSTVECQDQCESSGASGPRARRQAWAVTGLVVPAGQQQLLPPPDSKLVISYHLVQSSPGMYT